jgi:hypothetical protein
VIRVRYGVFYRGDLVCTCSKRESAETIVREMYPGGTIEPLTFTRQ